MTLRFHCTFCNIVLLPVATLTSDSFVPLLISITQILIPKEAKFYTLVSKWCFFLKTAKKPSLVTLMEIQIRLTHDSFFFLCMMWNFQNAAFYFCFATWETGSDGWEDRNGNLWTNWHHCTNIIPQFLPSLKLVLKPISKPFYAHVVHFNSRNPKMFIHAHFIHLLMSFICHILDYWCHIA